MWTIEKRRQKFVRGSMAQITRDLGEKKQFVSKVLHDQADLYSKERRIRVQEALAAAAGVSRRTMFGR